MPEVTVHAKTISAVKKYISADSADMLRNKILSLNNNRVSVTNTGVVSSGKSSLFNALLDRCDDDRFLVGSARTTIQKDIEKYSDNIDLVDTPGIDVKDEDDKNAFNAICSSSIIIMVHNIKMGMLQRNEVEWLQKISKIFRSKEELKDRFIFVCSWIDERMGDTSYDHTVEETKRILFDTMGTEVDVYCVSSKLYKQGMAENKPKFVEKSKICELKKAISDKAELYLSKYGNTAVKAEVRDICLDNSNKLTTVRNEIAAEEAEIREPIECRYNTYREQWDSCFDRFKNLRSKYIGLQNQLDDSY